MTWRVLDRPLPPAAFVLLACAWTAVARADAATDEAERLFRQGKEWLAQRNYTRACPLLAESVRVDRATGALLALAICHEGEGKLASALREYSEVLVRSANEGNPAREQAARNRASALAPQVSTLTLSFTGETAGVEVQLDGAPVDPVLFDRALPVDGGVHLVQVMGRKTKPLLTRVEVAERRDAKTVVVAAPREEPPSESAAGVRWSPPRARGAPPPQARNDTAIRGRRAGESPALSGWQWTGIFMLGTGAVGLGVGTFLTIDAVAKNDDSKLGCQDDVCTAVGRRDRLAARASGDLATVALTAGGVLAATGLLAYVLGRAEPAEEARLGAAAWMADESGGVSVRGSF